MTQIYHNTSERRETRLTSFALPFFWPLPHHQPWCMTGHSAKGWPREMTAWHQGSSLEIKSYLPLMVLLGNWWKVLKGEGCQSENLLRKMIKEKPIRTSFLKKVPQRVIILNCSMWNYATRHSHRGPRTSPNGLEARGTASTCIHHGTG